MESFYLKIIKSFFIVYNASTLYLLIGFTFAFLLYKLVSEQTLIKYIGKSNLKSVLLSALIGAPLPLCSCGVLPTAISLKRKGAAPGATLSFLVSTPETNINAILITFALMDPLMAIYRPIAATLIAILTGISANLFMNRKEFNENNSKSEEHNFEHCSSCEVKIKRSWKDAINFTFKELFDDLSYWLIFGLFLAGFVLAFLPADFFQKYFSNTLLSMILMMVVGIPLYLCATSTTPIVASLVAKGLNPGAALVLLITGPATNIASLMIIKKELGKKITVLYLLNIIIWSVIFGLFLNYLYGYFGIKPSINLISYTEGTQNNWLNYLASLIFSILLIQSFIRIGPPNTIIKLKNWVSKLIRIKIPDSSIKYIFIFILLILYLSSGLFQINPGEVGIVQRFGKIIRKISKGGLYFRFPYPIEKHKKIKADQIIRLEIGFRQTQTIYDESLMITGDENILDLKFTVHYKVKDPIIYLYKITDNEKLISYICQSIVRELIAGIKIDDILTNERYNLQNKALRRIQEEIKRLNLGVEVISILFLSSHAPPEVHYAFRDVASAYEDKNKEINLAYVYQEEKLGEARGKYERILNKAISEKIERIAKAKGESERFLLKLESYKLNKELIRFQILMDKLQEVLELPQKIITPENVNIKDYDLWLFDSSILTKFKLNEGFKTKEGKGKKEEQDLWWQYYIQGGKK